MRKCIAVENSTLLALCFPRFRLKWRLRLLDAALELMFAFHCVSKATTWFSNALSWLTDNSFKGKSVNISVTGFKLWSSLAISTCHLLFITFSCANLISFSVGLPLTKQTSVIDSLAVVSVAWSRSAVLVTLGASRATITLIAFIIPVYFLVPANTCNVSESLCVKMEWLHDNNFENAFILTTLIRCDWILTVIRLQSKNLCSLSGKTVLPFMLFPSIVQLSIHNRIGKTLFGDTQCFASLLLWSFTQRISERLELLICALEPFSRNCEFKVSRRLSDCDRPDSTLSHFVVFHARSVYWRQQAAEVWT